MSDQDDDQGESNFKKTAHRPWKASLLETTIAEADSLEFNFTTPFFNDISPDIGQPDTKLDAKPTSAISLGGFFQPQQLTKKPNLVEDLKHKQQELAELTTTFTITEALERSEHAELNRRAEAQSRLFVENQARKTIEQAQTVSEQFRKAMEEAHKSSIAFKESERLRKLAEDKTLELQLKLKNTEILLDNERLARTLAEQRAVQINPGFNELKPQYDELKRNFVTLQAENKIHTDKIYNLEIELRDITDKKNTLETKLTEATAQRDKLKTIIEAEQELRKNAEKRAQDSLFKAEQAEKARLMEVQQRKLVDERAKRAVEHANRTVMHLLNAPVGNEYTVQTPIDYATQEKIKIRVKTIEEDEVDNNQIY